MGALLFLFALLALPMGTCGTVGTRKLHSTRASFVEVTAPMLEALPTGTYVDADVVLDAEDPRTRAGRTIGGWTVYQVSGAPHVIVFSEAPLERKAHVVGQVCDEYSPFTCQMPDPQFAWYLRNGSTDPKPMRALVTDTAPTDGRWIAWTELAVAIVSAAGFVFAAASMLRASRQPGRVVASRTLTLARGAEDVRAAIREEASPQIRIAEDAPSRMCMLLGKPAGAARATGVDSPEMVPLRVDVELTAMDVYRGTTATITVRELIATPVAFHSIAVERATEWALGMVTG